MQSRTPSDQLTVRRLNLSLVLHHLQDRGPGSRARIAKETGLNKATITSLVGELLERGLVRERGVERHGGVGRPGQTVELAPRGAVGVGVEVNGDFIDATALDLLGCEVARHRVDRDLRRIGTEGALDAIAVAVNRVVAEVLGLGGVVVGVVVAVPGLVSHPGGVVVHAPNFGWRDLPLAELLRPRLRPLGMPLLVDNDGNLGAIGEHTVVARDGVSDIVHISGEVGIGGGIVVGGELLRGARGFSGEIGHMGINPDPQQCGCGLLGCWETQVGLQALLRACAHGDDDPLLDAGIDIETRLADVADRHRRGDERAVRALEHVGRGIGSGVAVLCNVLDPGLVVLGGYLTYLGELLVATVRDELPRHVVAPGGCDVVVSRLGFTAASRGGAVVALRRVLDDPGSVPLMTEDLAAGSPATPQPDRSTTVSNTR